MNPVEVIDVQQLPLGETRLEVVARSSQDDFVGIDRDEFVAWVLYEQLYVAEGAGLSQLVKVVPERVGVVSRHHSAGPATRGFKDTGRKTNVMLML